MVFASHEDYLRYIRSTPIEPEKYVEPAVEPAEKPEEPADEKPKRRKKA